MLNGLTPGVGYRMVVTSVEERGIRSPPAPLIATTRMMPPPPKNKRELDTNMLIARHLNKFRYHFEEE